MSIDARKNFAKGTVSTGYDASATSIALTAGHGARFPDAPFNATWWNSTDYPNPADDPNVEIVRVTARSTDTLTVTRAQESTSASTKNTSGKTYLLLAGPTAKTITDIETDIAGKQPLNANLTAEAGLTGAADRLSYFTGAGAKALATLTSFGRSLIAAADAAAAKTLLALTKSDVGLGNVDNTSDANKPVSTATQTALDAKADLVGGKLPASQLPDLAISEFLGEVANQAAMLALTGDRGDWCTRADTGSNWILVADDSSLLASWREVNYPASPVSSVNSRTGAITLTADDTPDGVTNKAYTTAEKTKLSGIEAAADVTDAGNVGSAIHGATGKTTPVDADTLPLIDSEASNVLKKLTWANLKATLKTYFDTFYTSYSNSSVESYLLGILADGEYLRRSGSSLDGGTPSGSGAPMLVVPFNFSGGTATAWTNMPAAATFLFGSSQGRIAAKVDLTNFTQCRLYVGKNNTVAGVGGSKLILRYATTAATGEGSYSDAGTSEVSVAIDVGSGGLDSGWIDLAAGAKADVWIVIIGSGGDGAADPTFGYIAAEFK